MKPCQQCFKNDWYFKKDGTFTVATCKNCKEEVRWERKKKPGKKKCKCGGTEFERVDNPDISPECLKLEFFYMKMMKCKQCGETTPDITTKRYNKLYKPCQK